MLLPKIASFEAPLEGNSCCLFQSRELWAEAIWRELPVSAKPTDPCGAEGLKVPVGLKAGVHHTGLPPVHGLLPKPCRLPLGSQGSALLLSQGTGGPTGQLPRLPWAGCSLMPSPERHSSCSMSKVSSVSLHPREPQPLPGPLIRQALGCLITQLPRRGETVCGPCAGGSEWRCLDPSQPPTCMSPRTGLPPPPHPSRWVTGSQTGPKLGCGQGAGGEPHIQGALIWGSFLPLQVPLFQIIGDSGEGRMGKNNRSHPAPRQGSLGEPQSPGTLAPTGPGTTQA